MITDELEQLEIILDKNPVIATWTAQDLLERPAMVRGNYLKHARSFVPLGRLSGSSEEDQLTIEEYEKRLIKLVKEKGAAKGYITADYGYGKTSTAIFVWQRCEQAEILAVPPFQIQQLHHLISATYGWVRFKLAGSYPQMVAEAEQIYHRYIDRDIDAEGRNESERQLLRRLYEEGSYNPRLRELDYIKFFEEMTSLAQKAHYRGLVVIADELQQYLEMNKSSGDPLASLFNLIQALITRKGELPFGLLFSVALKDLGFMNDYRGDLVQRLKSDKLALDLSLIYNQTFAHELWNQLARELQFKSLKDKIVLPETLEALGQISARPDLANGPRTVVDVFRLMSGQYKEQGDTAEPFSPLDLINAFLDGDISYDNTAKLQQVVSSHLTHQFVRNNVDYQEAIKLMAAFPIDGLPESYFDKYGVRPAIEALTQEARGDIVTFAGGGYDEHNQLRETRALLVGLEEHKVNTDWLATTIREFTRNYNEQVQQIRELAIKGFQQLLRNEVFKEGSWKILQSLDPTLSQNRAYIFAGAFNTTRKNYPDRRLHVRIMGEGEVLRDTSIDGDLAFNFELMLNIDQPEQIRRNIPGQIIYSQDKTTSFVLNMSHRGDLENYGDLNNTLGLAVAPWKMTPALLLSLYAYLDKKREANVIPKADDEVIRSNFQPILLEHALRELFNRELGTEMNANEARIVEEVVRRQLEAHYLQYKTLMTAPQWKHNLGEYRSALGKLPTPFERQGQQLYDKPKQELAKIFNRSVPALEAFISVNPLLIKEERGGWRFLLHPLETLILDQVKDSLLTESPRTPGGKARPYIKREVAIKAAEKLGYREEEFEEVIHLLEVRGLISLDPKRTRLVEEVTRVPQVAELRSLLNDYRNRLKIVQEALPDNVQVNSWIKEVEGSNKLIDRFATAPDEVKQSGLSNLLQTRQRDLDRLIQAEQDRMAQDLRRRIQQGIFKQANAEMLHQPLNGNLFATQLNTQRTSLLKEYTELTTKIEPLEAQLHALLQQAEQSLLPASGVLHVVQAHKHLQKDIHQLEQRQAQVNDLLRYYGQVRHLLSQAQALEQGFQTVPADLAAAFQNELGQWSLGITSELSSDKLNGLSHEPLWKEQLEAIQQRFDTQLRAERDSFASIQADYKSFLKEKFPMVEMWLDVTFNLAEPQDSYSRLWDGVHGVLKRVVEGIRRQVQEVYDRAARLQGGSLSNLPPAERPTLQTQLDKSLARLTEYRERTNKWLESVAAADFMDRVRERGAATSAEIMLKPVIMNVTMQTQDLPPIEHSIAEIEQKVLASSLSAEEEGILARLITLQQETGAGEGVELGLLLQNLSDHKASWDLIAQLYSKQRLRINIAPVVFD